MNEITFSIINKVAVPLSFLFFLIANIPKAHPMIGTILLIPLKGNKISDKTNSRIEIVSDVFL